MAGTLQANGLPEIDDDKTKAFGGSGGLVHIQTKNKNVENVLSPERVAIEARGGLGMNGGFGGSGGAIVLNGVKREPVELIDEYDFASTIGGIDNDDDLCGNGAAGIIFNAETSEAVVDNDEVFSTALTFLPLAFHTILVGAGANAVVWKTQSDL